MVNSISRQSVIIKCKIKKSVLLGNYEFYYLAGLMKKLYQLPLEETMKPKEMEAAILAQIDNIQPGSPEEEYMIGLVRFYDPLEVYDQDTILLFRWGEQEPDLWQTNTRFCPKA